MYLSFLFLYEKNIFSSEKRLYGGTIHQIVINAITLSFQVRQKVPAHFMLLELKRDSFATSYFEKWQRNLEHFQL